MLPFVCSVLSATAVSLEARQDGSDAGDGDGSNFIVLPCQARSTVFANQQDDYDHPALHDNNIYFDIDNNYNFDYNSKEQRHI